ncbi:hypothetical protein SKAU_G00248240 [Synaphobranchus kaupii]|uniref:Uncharacterized protein n=1 Tax=Synaphobranchus kaupii TaxID=118154 RepID=A0A9Q1F2B1_SYNKA|nr:hypothetical protein SKAU_G00248240 [Synaphobranchus kaupii]
MFDRSGSVFSPNTSDPTARDGSALTLMGTASWVGVLVGICRQKMSLLSGHGLPFCYSVPFVLRGEVRPLRNIAKSEKRPRRSGRQGLGSRIRHLPLSSGSSHIADKKPYLVICSELGPNSGEITAASILLNFAFILR